MEKQRQRTKTRHHPQRQQHRSRRPRLDRKMLRHCKQCGKTFKTKPYYIKKGYANYCSRQCFNIGRQKRVKRTCKYCGKEFYAMPYIIKKGFALYCGQPCQYKARAEFAEYRGKNNPKYNKIERTCRRCGKTFVALPNKIKQGHGLYCSKRCYAEYKKKTDTYKGKNSCFYKRIERTCLFCGKKLSIVPSRIKLGYGKYCSFDCEGKALSGKNSPHWKGGYYPYYGPTWRQTNKKTLKQAGYVSQISKNNGNRLAVHHIIPMRIFINKYIELCLAPYVPQINFTSLKVLPSTLIPDMIYEQANQADNLIVLTKEEHTRYEGMPLGFFDAIKKNKC